VGIALLLLGTRVVTTGRFSSAFLIWNLALALAPLPVGCLAIAALRRRTTAGFALGVGLAAVWLALFPNAPYLVTDFVHLHRRGEWSLLDVAMMTSFGAAGWLAAVRSLVAWSKLPFAVDRRLGLAALTSVGGLSGFGIYLGRVQRLNSWDLATDPRRVTTTIERVLTTELGAATLCSALFAVALGATTLVAIKRS
jgi:uncharacterized membrane protein